MNIDKIAGATALVTGAGNGLGRAIALELDARGAKVILVGRNASTLCDVADACTNAPVVAPCDTSDPGRIDQLSTVIADHDISILVNNAGIAGPVAPLTEIDPKEWDEVFAVNVRGVYLMSRALLPPMIARGRGQILTIASVSGKRPLANRTPYTASKMAVLGLSRTLAHEVGHLGIAVNTLSPGPVDGPRMERNFRMAALRTGGSPEDAEREFTSRSAFGRMVTAGEVANAAANVLNTPGLTGADIDLSAGMIAP